MKQSRQCPSQAIRINTKGRLDERFFYIKHWSVFIMFYVTELSRLHWRCQIEVSYLYKNSRYSEHIYEIWRRGKGRLRERAEVSNNNFKKYSKAHLE